MITLPASGGGPAVRFTILTSRLIRMECSRTGSFEDRPSQVFWFRQLPVPQFKHRSEKGKLHIETEFLHLSYEPTSRGFSASTLSIALKQTGRTWRYGDTARQAGNLKGTARTLDGDAGNTRLEDGLLSRDGWAVIDDSQSLVFNEQGWLELRPGAKPNPPQTLLQRMLAFLGLGAANSSPDYQDLYFFGYGQDIKACLADYTRVAGSIPLIPRYILGNWWSRYWEYTQDELQAWMDEFRQHEIPLSVCIVDMDWHITKTGNSSSGWTGYTWNRALFPDPPGFIRWLHEQGLHTALNLHPALGIHPHEEQYDEMARWMGIDPQTQQPIAFDLTDPRFAEGYFEILHHPQEQIGVDFWWMDWQQGRHSRLPGLDPLWWINHLHYQDLGRDGLKRPFIFSRWGGLGNHRYPIGFSGDTFVQWRTLAYQPAFTATAANVAYAWWSHDIGGHMGKEGTPELYVRWVQFGVFSPIFRLHSTKHASLERHPWGKPQRFYQAAKAAMQLRHRLIPYLYSMAWRAHRSGIAPITPMYYDGKGSQADAFRASDQYYFGSELVVAPFLAPAQEPHGLARRKVWLPITPGGAQAKSSQPWTHFFNGQTYPGGTWHSIQGNLEDIPVFARPGAIVPLSPPRGWGGIDLPEELDIYVFPGAENEFFLYEDDGETTSYLQGDYALTRFTLKPGDDGQLEFTIHPAESEQAGAIQRLPSRRTYRIHLRGVEPIVTASLATAYDSATRTLSTEPFGLTPHEAIRVIFHMRS
jgi:hypothetical protein